jgi:hypothetical protein
MQIFIADATDFLNARREIARRYYDKEEKSALPESFRFTHGVSKQQTDKGSLG